MRVLAEVVAEEADAPYDQEHLGGGDLECSPEPRRASAEAAPRPGRLCHRLHHRRRRIAAAAAATAATAAATDGADGAAAGAGVGVGVGQRDGRRRRARAVLARRAVLALHLAQLGQVVHLAW